MSLIEDFNRVSELGELVGADQHDPVVELRVKLITDSLDIVRRFDKGLERVPVPFEPLVFEIANNRLDSPASCRSVFVDDHQ